MEKLHYLIPKTVYTKTAFTSDEIKEALLKHKPKGLMINKYSAKKFAILIQDLNENEITWRWDSAADKGFDTMKWIHFYTSIMQYINDIEFESFKCYEINVVQSRIHGCNNQCKECNIEQNNLKK